MIDESAEEQQQAPKCRRTPVVVALALGALSGFMLSEHRTLMNPLLCDGQVRKDFAGLRECVTDIAERGSIEDALAWLHHAGFERCSESFQHRLLASSSSSSSGARPHSAESRVFFCKYLECKGVPRLPIDKYFPAWSSQLFSLSITVDHGKISAVSGGWDKTGRGYHVCKSD